MFSVQYHPEASPGPRDSHYLFERFVDLMREHKGAPPPWYRLVIFDLDGTLADLFPWFSRVLNDVADRYRFKRVDRTRSTHCGRWMPAR